jgi:hypothetical protein
MDWCDAWLKGSVRWLSAVLILIVLLPIGLSAGCHLLQQNRPLHWWEARTDSTGLAPDPSTTVKAVLQRIFPQLVSSIFRTIY